MNRDIDRVLDSHSVPEPYSGCILWDGPMRSVYGGLCVNGRQLYAHRASYERRYGPIVPGLEIDHLCKTPLCINPAHLEAVTPTENKRRTRRRMKHCKHGHEYRPGTFRMRPDKKREQPFRDCLICRANSAAKFKALNPNYVSPSVRASEVPSVLKRNKVL